MSDNPKWNIIQGDALQLLPNFVPGTFDAIITEIILLSLIQSQGIIKKCAFAV